MREGHTVKQMSGEHLVNALLVCCCQTYVCDVYTVAFKLVHFDFYVKEKEDSDVA